MAEFPAPLTPADCDLRGLPYMPMDVVRLLDSDLFALSTGEEFKVALTLWCKSWQQVPAASLPDDDRVLAHLSGMGARWKRLRDMALRGWVKCSDGRFYHPVVAEKAAEAWKHRQAQRDRANKRWGNIEDGSFGDATGMPRHSHGSTGATNTAMQAKPKPSQASTNTHRPSLTTSREKPPPGITDAAIAFEYVCRAADWRAANDTQRQNGISIIAGWLALGCTLELILDGIEMARKRDPSPTRTLKRFDSTIRGMRRDQLGGELPVTGAEVDALRAGAAKRLATG